MKKLLMTDWLALWRETGNYEAIARELSADVPRLRELRLNYRVCRHSRRFELYLDEIEPVMRKVADISRASGVSVAELVQMADRRRGP